MTENPGPASQPFTHPTLEGRPVLIGDWLRNRDRHDIVVCVRAVRIVAEGNWYVSGAWYDLAGADAERCAPPEPFLHAVSDETRRTAAKYLNRLVDLALSGDCGQMYDSPELDLIIETAAELVVTDPFQPDF